MLDTRKGTKISQITSIKRYDLLGCLDWDAVSCYKHKG